MPCQFPQNKICGFGLWRMYHKMTKDPMSITCFFRQLSSDRRGYKEQHISERTIGDVFKRLGERHDLRDLKELTGKSGRTSNVTVSRHVLNAKDKDIQGLTGHEEIASLDPYDVVLSNLPGSASSGARHMRRLSVFKTADVEENPNAADINDQPILKKSRVLNDHESLDVDNDGKERLDVADDQPVLKRSMDLHNHGLSKQKPALLSQEARLHDDDDCRPFGDVLGSASIVAHNVFVTNASNSVVNIAKPGGHPQQLSSKLMASHADDVPMDFLSKSKHCTLKQKIFLSNHDFETFQQAKDFLVRLHHSGVSLMKQGITCCDKSIRRLYESSSLEEVVAKKGFNADSFKSARALIWEIADCGIMISELFDDSLLVPSWDH
eukprot:TRINITY_DN330_c0_g1_i1.p1 TRINITY_DN330_c0_g1~~TRINITY_DN330_c0_g1_i1.p1  ORF type:complete len:380 (-),score=91.46 TRINITY_DN330_c0_g1_i1:271-1410(-)